MKKDKKNIKNSSEQVTKNKLESTFSKKSVSKNEGTIPPVTHKSHDKPESKEEIEANKAKLQTFKDNQKAIKKLTKTHSKEILAGKIISMTNNTPDTKTNVIELFDVKKSYLTGDLEYEVLKGVNLKIKLGDFVVILGPSGSGKTTLLNIISGLDKPNTGDVFVVGYNLSLLKDSHLTKFRRDNVGFIFQQYNLLTNLTARENAEVGENLAKNKNKNMSIDDIFQVIEMDKHMNKFPSQLSGGQQQRVSIGRALAKNPTILFCDEPTGALDEEMGRKVLEILLDVNREYKTSIIMVTHNPNFQYVANTVINVKNGKIISVKNNEKPMKPNEINWS
ncbi:ABC transporter ATP-binding protein [Spiroplasma ixodetis]|uniref:ABC transporter ATP-binding protein n=1 Tax=Spiroplasma ixodetis TaxID=2141 RepID=UPI002577A23C|nr:ABC transporter ATP-binding protein [Spiroplasma ixodetis]WJG70156.1 ABC transporter ATP-binding protein [Spiroplasma ixodetis Y32]